jgi:hypothetical protein
MAMPIGLFPIFLGTPLKSVFSNPSSIDQCFILKDLISQKALADK